MKLLVFGICLSLLSVFAAFDADARPPCGKVWVDGHHNKHGKWVEAHWKHQHWVPGHHNRHGDWVPGHCR